LIRRLFGLAWRYRAQCIGVLLIQIVLLTMGILGLSFTGVGIDYIRHTLTAEVAMPHLQFGLSLPAKWQPMQVLVLLAGLILGLAVCRAVLNYVYAVSINKLVQQGLVLDMRSGFTTSCSG
jgi:ATP-binding cassette subfamily B protein